MTGYTKIASFIREKDCISYKYFDDPILKVVQESKDTFVTSFDNVISNKFGDINIKNLAELLSHNTSLPKVFTYETSTYKEEGGYYIIKIKNDELAIYKDTVAVVKDNIVMMYNKTDKDQFNKSNMYAVLYNIEGIFYTYSLDENKFRFKAPNLYVECSNFINKTRFDILPLSSLPTNITIGFDNYTIKYDEYGIMKSIKPDTRTADDNDNLCDYNVFIIDCGIMIWSFHCHLYDPFDLRFNLESFGHYALDKLIINDDDVKFYREIYTKNKGDRI